MSRIRELRQTYILLTLMVYAASFVLPVFDHDFFGIQAFLYGLLYCWLIPGGLPWFANIALWLGLYYLNLERWREAKWCGAAAIGLALTVLPIWWKHEIPGIGYHVWLFSMVILARGALRGEAVERCERDERKRLVWEHRLRQGNLGAVEL